MSPANFSVHLTRLSNMLCVFRPVCSGLPDSPGQPALQPVRGSHLLPHGVAEVRRQASRTGAAGTVCVSLTYIFDL